jgi:RHS repeat-associated protein
MNDGLTVPANTTLNSFSKWGENLLANVSGATVSSYSWNLTNAPDATNVTGSSSQNLQLTWATFTGAARSDTIVLTTTNSDSTHAVQTLVYQVAGSDSPAYSTRPTTPTTWPSVVTPDTILAGQQGTSAGMGGVGQAVGNLQTSFTLPGYNPGVAPLSLDYNSMVANSASPIFNVHYQLNPSGTLPATVNVSVSINNGSSYQATWGTTGLNPGDILEIPVQGNASGLATGRYPYSITVSPNTGTATTYTGNFDLVNESASAFGAGWSLGNVSQVVSVTGGVILVQPGGTSLWFASAGGNNYTTPPGDFSKLVKNGDSTYTRTFPDGTKVNFNSTGYQTSIVDRVGNTTAFGWNGSNLLTSITDMNNLVTTLAYSSSNLLTQVTDPALRATGLAYNASKQLTAITQPDSGVWSYAYDVSNDMTGQSDPLNQTATYTLGTDNNRVTGVSLPGSVSQSYQPVDLVGWQKMTLQLSLRGTPPTAALLAAAPETYTDGLSNTWQYGMDWTGFGSVVTASDPLGDTAITAHDANDLPWLSADPLGRRTRAFFDSNANVTEAVYADDTKDLYSYNNFSEVTLHTDQLGGLWSYNYDSVGNLTKATDPLLNVTSYSYTNKGSISITTDPLGHLSTIAYDNRNRVTRVTDALNEITSLAYDNASNVTAQTDPLNHITSHSFDSMNRVLTETLANGGTTSYAHNADGMVTSITDPVLNITSYAYDGLNRLTKVTDPSTNLTTYAYDKANNLTAQTDRDGRQITYAYDQANRLTAETWVSGSYTATFSYDQASQLTQALDSFSEYSYSYTKVGLLSSVDNSGTPGVPHVIMTYGYDKAEDRTTLTDSLSGSISYGYDADHHLTQISTPVTGGNALLSFGFDAASRLTSITRTAPSGHTIASSYAYDKVDRLTNIVHTDTTASTTLANYTYGFDQASRLTSYSGPEGNLTYSYDNSDQLTGVSGARNETYTYDKNGNRTMTGYSTGTGNELLNDGTNSYAYDKEGHLTAQTQLSNSQKTAYSYDYENRLTEIKVTSSTGLVLNDEKFTYDINGKQIGVSLNGTQQRYTVYDGSNPYIDFSGTGSLSERYITNPKALDQFVARVSSGGTLNWYLTDNLGSIREIVGTAGSVLDKLIYGTFGGLVSETNSNSGDRFKFAGGQYDSVSGDYHFGARYYSPADGRWIAQDPQGLRADSNLYRYVVNDPVTLTDPKGEHWVAPWDPGADWTDWRIGEALGDFWNGPGGGATGGGVVGGGSGAVGAGVVVFIISGTPIGWAGWTVIGIGAGLGAIYGIVHGYNDGSGPAAVKDPENYIVPGVIGAVTAARMYRLTDDGPYVDWPWLP